MTAPNERWPYEYPEKVKLRSYNPCRGGGIQVKIKKAVDMMLGARRPIIYAGGGVIPVCSDKLVELVKRLNFR